MRRNAEGAPGGASNAALFGEVLRHYREGALLTQEALARQIPCDRSQVAKIEAGTRVPSDQFAKRCDEVLDTGGVLARMWEKIDWYPEVQHPDWFARRVELDEQAVALRAYHEQLIPGLLQTPGYARALFSLVATGDELEERVRARMSRQPRFLDDGGPLYVVILDESCLRNPVGSPEIMREQCAHLLSAGQRPNIRIQVAPTGAYGLVRPRVSMSLIELPDERWIYSESQGRGHFINDPELYANGSRIYDVLRADIPSARESAALISNVMEGYEQHGQVPAERGDLDQEQSQRGGRRRLRRSRPRYPRHPRPRSRQQEP
ncbi:helix-turn-helix domain-containing protein [Streptomyces griseiscabiei]|uniref:Helix-turn-helix transcriptional regulator n=1 Tax=Streptomyces griseiscabiei TaxID=2993540 RepID=A0ABU4LET1_9ACTN|nr:helix-turn-helix transcriptional regulator [Streptomyces griseiscabiei]MBZ3907200.1 helix-turn-helix domain-containing protein [Streptomyces griseiscabiei]MDX2914300.1 helix-turn-helix transcriptional regulator [Streptomyces griseiscabiei]